MDFNYRYLGKINWIEYLSLFLRVKRFTDGDWNEFSVRQKVFKAHAATKTIPVLMDEFLADPKTKWYFIFESFLKNLENKLSKHYGKGSVERCILVKLPKQTRIDQHIDSGIFLEKTKRIHLPIITNSKVLFLIDNEERNLKRRELWEINNTQKVHGVINDGDNDRVHMIVDFLPQ